MKISRVKQAYLEKESYLSNLYRENKLSLYQSQIFFRIFKHENVLELWARKTAADTFVLIKQYPVCYASGTLGPKRKEGDMQVPEGFYKINHFNPNSAFHLSLCINYPNSSDRILSDPKTPGGDMYIHGSCVSIGCLAMTDDKIKELYIAAVEAVNNGQKTIWCHIFPYKMNSANHKAMQEKYRDHVALINFWTNLKTGYDYFERSKRIPKVSVDVTGKYMFN
ncbi:MAG: L,D-transpeptidase family protein [Cytophagaceae bacterium]|nr:L,D-transpeptidase family protein [Cytophagaceae bacterium]MDW8457050.1 L,D-transpeptidase family protein [Cytophagaceae bacterium]